MRNFTNFKIIMFKLQNSYVTNYGPKKSINSFESIRWRKEASKICADT
jgi:hypothetical protein